MHNPQTIYFSDFVQTWLSLCFDMQWSDSKCTTPLFACGYGCCHPSLASLHAVAPEHTLPLR